MRNLQRGAYKKLKLHKGRMSKKYNSGKSKW